MSTGKYRSHFQFYRIHILSRSEVKDLGDMQPHSGNRYSETCYGGKWLGLTMVQEKCRFELLHTAHTENPPTHHLCVTQQTLPCSLEMAVCQGWGIPPSQAPTEEKLLRLWNHFTDFQMKVIRAKQDSKNKPLHNFLHHSREDRETNHSSQATGKPQLSSFLPHTLSHVHFHGASKQESDFKSSLPTTSFGRLWRSSKGVSRVLVSTFRITTSSRAMFLTFCK